MKITLVLKYRGNFLPATFWDIKEKLEKIAEEYENAKVTWEKEQFPDMTAEDAIATMKSSMITAFWKTSSFTGLTIDKCSELQDGLIKELFHPSVRWAVKRYIESLECEEE